MVNLEQSYKRRLREIMWLWVQFAKQSLTRYDSVLFSNVLQDFYANSSVEPANKRIKHGSLWKKRKIGGDGSPTTILKAAAPIFLQFGSYVQQKWPLQEPITTELAAFKCSRRAVYF